MNKRKMIARQILWRTGLVLGLIGVLTSMLVYHVMTQDLKHHLDDDVNSTKQMITNTLQSTQDSAKIVESVIGRQLLNSSKVIAEELRGKSIDQISNDDLKRLTEEHGLYGLSLFVRKGDDIIVERSSDSEVGLNAKDWGYWYDAFNQLLDKQPVTVEKGYRDQNFWMGPTSISSWNHHYFKYAYYYDGTTPFLIDAYVLDEDTNRLNFETGLSAMISKIKQINPTIEEVAVLNVPAYLKGTKARVGEPEYDVPILYGHMTHSMPEDNLILRSMQNGGSETSLEFTNSNGHLMKKFYIPLPEQRVMTIVADLQSQESMVRQFTVMLLVSFLLAFLVILTVISMVARRQLKPVGEIEEFLSRVSRGDLSGKLEVRENNELGWLAGQINVMTEKLGGLIFELNKQKEETITHISNYDALTNLPNRKLYKDHLEHAVEAAKRNHTTVALMVLDLDRFKNVNDVLGHAIGDHLLLTVAQRLETCLMEEHILARLGGDEFALLISQALRPDEAAKVAQGILRVFEQPLRHEGHDFHLTTSIGIAVFPQDGSDVETLMKNADAAMYSAKQQGGNNFQFYTPSLNALILEQVMMEKSLRDAIDNDELMVFYQPLVEVQNGQIIGMEALIRWNSAEFGMVSPARFIPVAESSGLIVPIGEWVLRTACRQNKAWQEAGFPPLRVAVNLSARQFEHPELVDTVAGILQETGLEPEFLKLEITESLAMRNADLAIEKLHALKYLGILIAIDDFGTGYSSLSYLKKFPIDTLKIDQSFVGDIQNDSDDAAIVTAIIAMAHNLKINVVAEGVETPEQLQFLREQHCDEMQGYLFSRPVPDHLFEKLLVEGKTLDAEANGFNK